MVRSVVRRGRRWRRRRKKEEKRSQKAEEVGRMLVEMEKTERCKHVKEREKSRGKVVDGLSVGMKKTDKRWKEQKSRRGQWDVERKGSEGSGRNKDKYEASSGGEEELKRMERIERGGDNKSR